VRTAVINKRAAGMDHLRAGVPAAARRGVKLLNAIQDVYLDKRVTIA
jgi:class I fructose-bisphosphate aldolase